MEHNKEALDILFGEDNEVVNQTLDILKDEIKSEEHGFNEQISTHSMNDKSVIDVVKEKVEEFKEYNNLTTDPNDKLISTKNSDEALPDELAKEEGVLISTANSDRALPDELSSQDGVPICKQSTEGIHDGDSTPNEELISSHNSDSALIDNDVPLSSHNSEELL